MAYQTLFVAQEAGVVTVTFNRPDRLNALDREMAGELAQVVDEVAADPGARVLLTSPRGVPLTQRLVEELAAHGRLIIVCGRYEGVDERVTREVDMEVSAGDFVLTGGELAALCVVDAAARLVPGVLGNDTSAGRESFAGEPILEYPQYTRPPVFRGMEVPPVLLSGDHRRVERWRRREALRTTRDRRPDLFARLVMNEEDRRLIEAGDDEL